jgi:hypothetical protein
MSSTVASFFSSVFPTAHADEEKPPKDEGEAQEEEEEDDEEAGPEDVRNLDGSTAVLTR